MSIRIALRGLLLIASFVAIGYALKVSGLDTVLTADWIDQNLRGQRLSAEVIFVLIGLAATAVGLPRQLIAFLGGHAFGFWLGGALALLAAVLGGIAAFYYARLFGRALVARRFPGRVRRIDDFLSENPFSMTLLIRLLPVGSNLVTNLAAGVSSVGAAAFFTGSALGYVPQTAVFALIGSGVGVGASWQVALSVVLFLISGALGIRLYRTYRRGKRLGDDVGREIDPA